jgi:hypothetical protein
MHDWQSLAPLAWEGKHRLVIIPMYRRKLSCAHLPWQIERILRKPCERRGMKWYSMAKEDGGKILSLHTHANITIASAWDSRSSSRASTLQEASGAPPFTAPVGKVIGGHGVVGRWAASARHRESDLPLSPRLPGRGARAATRAGSLPRRARMQIKQG